MKAPSDNQRRYLDATAILLSGVCLVHCLALPVVLTLLPVFNVMLLDEAVFHLIMLVFILPVSVVALAVGCRQHKDRATILLGTAGLSILTATAIFGHDWFGLTGERLVTSLGGLVLAAAHIQNYRCCREHDCRHEH